MSHSSEQQSSLFLNRTLYRRAMVALPILAAAASSSQPVNGDNFAALIGDQDNGAQRSPNQQTETAPTISGAYVPRYCLNTSTINGSQLPLRRQLKIASDAGYHSVELWLRDIEKYVDEGGSLSDLKAEISDLGLELDGAIAFSRWIVDDPTERSAALDQFQREAKLIQKLGGSRMAAPPAGATDAPKLNLDSAADRYRQLIEIGRDIGVTPQLELWGFSSNLSTLAEVLYVAAAASHPDACILLDVYHLYKGGSDFLNMSLVPAANMACLHLNDYPAEPDRQTIADKDRVFPGDGIAPLSRILSSFFQSGFRGTLSLELFNRAYWEMPPEEVAGIGLEKMKHVVGRALSSEDEPA